MLVLDGVEMLDVRETALVAGRTPETVRRWIWSGRLPGRRHGNKLLVARTDVDDMVHGGAESPGMSLSEWADAVSAARLDGSLGEPGGAQGSAADLVLEDRADRQAG